MVTVFGYPSIGYKIGVEGVMSAGRIILLCMVARFLFVLCCVVLFFTRFSKSELKNPPIPEPKSYNKTYPAVIDAAFKGDIERLKKILAQDGDPNVRAFDNSTAMQFSARNGDDSNGPAVVAELLRAGARARVTDDFGATPLHEVGAIAVFARRNVVIGMLFLHGADMNAHGKKQIGGTAKVAKQQDYTPLDMLVNNFDRTGVIDFLEKWGGLIPKEELIRSSKFSYELGMRDITTAIDSYNEANGLWRKHLESIGLNSIMISALTGDTLNTNKNINDKNTVSTDAYKRTPLHWAVIRHNTTIAEILVQAGANVMAKDYQENTPLHIVAWLGDIEIQKNMTTLLMKNKASLKAQNDQRDTVLHRAIRLRDYPYVQYLVNTYKPEDLGLSMNNKDGLTPYLLAERLGLRDMMKIVPKR